MKKIDEYQLIGQPLILSGTSCNATLAIADVYTVEWCACHMTSVLLIKTFPGNPCYKQLQRYMNY